MSPDRRVARSAVKPLCLQIAQWGNRPLSALRRPHWVVARRCLLRMGFRRHAHPIHSSRIPATIIFRRDFTTGECPPELSVTAAVGPTVTLAFPRERNYTCGSDRRPDYAAGSAQRTDQQSRSVAEAASVDRCPGKVVEESPRRGLLTALAIVHTLEPFIRFTRQREVAAYVGLEPMVRSSAQRQRYLGIRKAGSRLLRFLLGKAAQVAARFDAELKQFYDRLAKRRGKKKATVAVARKLLSRCWILLRYNIDYSEFRSRAVEAWLARNKIRPSMPVE